MVLLSLLIACTDKVTNGTVDVVAWGEEAAVGGFPNDELAFADGWSVTYNTVLVSFGDLAFSDPSTGDVVASDDALRIVDLHLAEAPAALTSIELPEGRHDVSYAVLPATLEAEVVNAAPEDALAAMIAGGFNTYLRGVAQKDGASVGFAWGLRNPARYVACENGLDGTAGLAVVGEESVTAELSFHLDHLYWDQLGVEEASLRFQGVAAWADASRQVPFEDLAEAPTDALVDRNGNPVLDENGAQLSYNDAGLGLDNLRSFMLYSVQEAGHLNGVGECAVQGLDR